jgi:flotillin
MKNAGIAEQLSISEIAKAEKMTAEQKMEVVKVNEIKQAEIDKEKAIIMADLEKAKVEIDATANKFKVETDATAQLQAQNKQAEGKKMIGLAEAEVIKAKGMSDAEAKKAMELANVTAQTTLAEKIGENQSYQDYMVRIREVEKDQIVGITQYQSIATALSKADLKLLVNSGDVNSGIGKFTDIFTSKGASQINGMIEGLKQTSEGSAIASLVENVIKKD